MSNVPPHPTDLVQTYAEARAHMVDSQVRPNRVTDPRILLAMRTLPRELFVPPDKAPLAYIDEDVSLGNGRVLMEPMVLARLLQLAEVQVGESALVIGAGSLYGATVLASCGARVTALEEDTSLVALARSAQKTVPQAAAVNLVVGELGRGWPYAAPYDLVFIEGAVAELPRRLSTQLKPETGRLVTVVSPDGHLGQAIIAERVDDDLAPRPAFDCSTPLLPAFRAAPAFVF